MQKRPKWQNNKKTGTQIALDAVYHTKRRLKKTVALLQILMQ